MSSIRQPADRIAIMNSVRVRHTKMCARRAELCARRAELCARRAELCVQRAELNG